MKSNLGCAGLFCAWISICTTACGEDYGGGEQSPGEKKPVVITVESAVEMGKVKGLLPMKQGHKFVRIKLKFSNNLTDTPLSVAYPLFRLATSAGVEHLTSTQTAKLTDHCPAGISVSPGMDYSCTVLFEVPTSETSAKLWYRGTAHKASADLSVTPCTPCDNDCVDLTSNAKHCGKCNNPVGKGATCKKGKMTCDNASHTLCGSDCMDLMTDPAHCGKCGAALDKSQVCQGGKPTCPGSQTMCGQECVFLGTSSKHCGKCNRACADGHCVSGTECNKKFSCSTSYANCPKGKSCLTRCQEKGYTGCREAEFSYAYSYGGGYTTLKLGCTISPPDEHPQQSSKYLKSVSCTCIVPFS